jgi:hypothetical protein
MLSCSTVFKSQRFFETGKFVACIASIGKDLRIDKSSLGWVARGFSEIRHEQRGVEIIARLALEETLSNEQGFVLV